MSELSNVNVIKQTISVSEFEKRVEMEAESLMYFEYMKKEKAFSKARDVVREKFNTK